MPKLRTNQAVSAPPPEEHRHWQVVKTLDGLGFMLIYAEEHSVISIGFHTEAEFRGALENIIGQYKAIKLRDAEKTGNYILNSPKD